MVNRIFRVTQLYAAFLKRIYMSTGLTAFRKFDMRNIGTFVTACQAPGLSTNIEHRRAFLERGSIRADINIKKKLCMPEEETSL